MARRFLRTHHLLTILPASRHQRYGLNTHKTSCAMHPLAHPGNPSLVTGVNERGSNNIAGLGLENRSAREDTGHCEALTPADCVGLIWWDGVGGIPGGLQSQNTVFSGSESDIGDVPFGQIVATQLETHLAQGNYIETALYYERPEEFGVDEATRISTSIADAGLGRAERHWWPHRDT